MAGNKLSVVLKRDGKEFEAEIDLGALLSIYDHAVDVLQDGISAGNANAPEGLMSLLAYQDLLHGGAYKNPPWLLPYYSISVQQQLAFQQQTTQNGIVQFFLPNPVEIQLPNGERIALPSGAKPEQCEDMINAAEPRMLPKILSDQQHFVTKEWASLFFGTGLFNSFATGVNTLVQAERAVRGGGTSGRGRTPSKKSPSKSPSDRKLLEKAAIAAATKK